MMSLAFKFKVSCVGKSRSCRVKWKEW